MKHFYSSILLLLFISSCNWQNKTETKKVMTEEQAKVNALGVDEYFIETQDTVSKYGPQNISRTMLQDQNGNYWFSTWEGIIRYDGNVFTNVTLKEGLIHFHASTVFEDLAGNLWFGVFGGGLYFYNGKSFTHFTKTDGLVSNYINCIQEDMVGNIWFGTFEGVSCYNGKSFTNFTIKDGLSSNRINSILKDKTGKLWFGTDAGINCYDGKSFNNFTIKEGLPFSNVSTIIQDKKGNIWIGAGDGLYCYDGKTVTNVLKNSIVSVFEDKKGNLWLSVDKANVNWLSTGQEADHSKTLNTYNGMVLCRYDGKLFTEILAKSDSKESWRNQIFEGFEDKSGNIWFGTVNGVCRYDGKSFTDFSKNVPKQ